MLTPREIDVMNALVETGCNKGAARKLHLGEKTVEHHSQSVQRKLGGNRMQALLAWVRFTEYGKPLTFADTTKPERQLSANTKAILRLGRATEGTTNADVALVLGVTANEAGSRLNQLVKSGRMVKEHGPVSGYVFKTKKG